MHPLWAHSVGQRGTLRHLHERFLIDGILGLWRQRHVKCHVLVIEHVCLALVVRFDRHVAGQATIFRLTRSHHLRPGTYLALPAHSRRATASQCPG